MSDNETEDQQEKIFPDSEPPPFMATIKYGAPHCQACGGSWMMTDYQTYMSCSNHACPEHGQKFSYPIVELKRLP